MKKLCIIITIMFLSISSLVKAQEASLGLTGGLFIGSANLSVGGFDLGDISDDLKINDGAGFYLGLVADITLIEKLHVQPELLYANIGGESAIVIPVMAKYYIADQLNIQAGPQLDVVLDVPNLVDNAVKKSGMSIAFGAGYDINDKFALQAKYSIGLSNRVDKNLDDLIPDGFLGSLLNPELKADSFQVGIVYNFN